MERWKKIIEYYRACITAENTADTELRRTDEYKNFISFSNERECISHNSDAIPIDEQNPHVQSFMQGTRWKSAPRAYFYGFPCQVLNNGTVYPLMVFDVALEQKSDGEEYIVQPNKPRLNLSAFFSQMNANEMRYITTEEKRQIIEEFNEIWDDNAPLLDNVETALNKWDEARSGLKIQTLLNKPFGVMFYSESTYTAGLEQELKEIAARTEPPSAVCDLILNRDKIPVEDTSEDIIEVTPLNDEQRRAVKSAFKNTLTLVTGPPGTGKSQIILNVIINALKNDEFVLFGSKNHKAVNVITERLSRLQSQPIMLKYGDREIEFAEALLQAVGYATAQKREVTEREVKDYERELDRVRKEGLQAEQTLVKIITRRNNIRNIEIDLETTSSELYTYPEFTENIKPYEPIVFKRPLTPQIPAVKRSADQAAQVTNDLESIASGLPEEIRANIYPGNEIEFGETFKGSANNLNRLYDSIIEIEARLETLICEFPDNIKANITNYGETTVDDIFTKETQRVTHLDAKVRSIESDLQSIRSKLPAAIAGNLALHSLIALEESFSDKIEETHRAVKDFTAPGWLTKIVRIASVIGQKLSYKRMVVSAQRLKEGMPDYCGDIPCQTPKEIGELLVVAGRLHQFKNLQGELLKATRENNHAAQSLLATLPECFANIPAETNNDIRKLLHIVGTYQRYDTAQRELARINFQCEQTKKLVMDSLPECCANAPIETKSDLQDLVAIAKTIQEYDNKRNEIQQTNEVLDKAAQLLIESLPDYCSNIPCETPEDGHELAAVANTLLRYKNKQFNLLKQIESNWREPRLEVLRSRIETSQERAIDIGVNLVNALMVLRLNRLKPREHRAIIDYAQHLRSLRNRYTGEQLRREIRKASEKAFRAGVTRAFPAIAVTNLSVRRAVPLQREAVDLVVIDEASQCDVASALPMLYRGKRALVIGDPNQLTHIANLHPSEDAHLLESNNIEIEDRRFSYITNSLFDLTRTTVGNGCQFIPLIEHYRSKSEIIGFSNKEFYQNRLTVHTDYRDLPSTAHVNPVNWHNVEGDTVRPRNGGAYNEAEARKVVDVLQQIIAKSESYGKYPSIGVVTPFRAQANRIRSLVRNRIRPEHLTKIGFTADTAHQYQGDEKDIMVFSPVISRRASESSIRFLDNNPNLFNVAITRARSELHIVGDMARCQTSNTNYLSRFVEYVKELDKPSESINEVELFESPWEKKFYDALMAQGIISIPQYRFDQYKLDLALPEAMIDIEIDGKQWHQNLDGSRVLSDLKRDTHLSSRGWTIKRFWVYELQSDLDKCVQEVMKEIKTNDHMASLLSHASEVQ